MNLVGKIFTVLIFVMSLVFMSFAVAVYATHRNWREIVMLPAQEATGGKELGLKFQLENARAVSSELRDRLEKMEQELEQEKIAHRNAVSKLETAVADLEGKNTDFEQRLQETTQEANRLTETLGTVESRNEKLLAQVLSLRQEIRDAQKDQFEKEDLLTQKTDELLQAEAERRRLKDNMTRITKELVDAKDVLRMFGLIGDPNYYKVSKVEGEVLAVQGNGLLEISIGSDDGVLKGGTMRVIRADGSMYLGQVEVLETRPDRAVCRIIQGRQQGAINERDLVIADLTDVQPIASN